MKKKKQQIFTMFDSLLLGVLIVFGDKISYGVQFLYFYGWWKLIVGIIMLCLVVALGISTLMEKDE